MVLLDEDGVAQSNVSFVLFGRVKRRSVTSDDVSDVLVFIVVLVVSN